MPKTIDMIGKRFGKRVVIGPAPSKQWNIGKRFWTVRCDCGQAEDVLGQALRAGKANQCCQCRAKELGRRSTTHGHTRRGRHSGTWNSWSSMRYRCLSPTNKNWHIWGGRGIKICDRWSGPDGFLNFLADMGERPEGKTLDRFPDFNGNYEPGNCRWATPKEQVNNQRKHGLIDTFTTEELLSELQRRGIK